MDDEKKDDVPPSTIEQSSNKIEIAIQKDYLVIGYPLFIYYVPKYTKKKFKT